MDFDQLRVRFFDIAEIAELAPDRLTAGIDRLLLRFGLERESGRRFALRCFAYMLGAAPGLGVVSTAQVDREAARDFMDTVGREIEADG